MLLQQWEDRTTKKTKFTLAYFIWNSQDAHFSFKHRGNKFKNLMKFDISK